LPSTSVARNCRTTRLQSTQAVDARSRHATSRQRAVPQRRHASLERWQRRGDRRESIVCESRFATGTHAAVTG
jgi:hypothetical protein